MAHDADAESFGQQLERARIAAGSPSYRSLEREALSAIGSTAPSNQTIANYHHGKVPPETANLELVCFLAGRYGVGLGTLSPTIAARWENARDLVLSASPCTTASDGLLAACAA